MHYAASLGRRFYHKATEKLDGVAILFEIRYLFVVFGITA